MNAYCEHCLSEKKNIVKKLGNEIQLKIEEIEEDLQRLFFRFMYREDVPLKEAIAILAKFWELNRDQIWRVDLFYQEIVEAINLWKEVMSALKEAAGKSKREFSTNDELYGALGNMSAVHDKKMIINSLFLQLEKDAKKLNEWAALIERQFPAEELKSVWINGEIR